MDARARQCQILFVDDEAKALTYFTMMFEDDFNVVTASSVDEAVAYLEANADQVAVLVTDQRMPGKTGVELMEHVRHRYPTIVRILTTAYSDLEAAIRSVNEGGAFRYLTKPWNKDDMTGSLLRAIDYHFAMRDRDQFLREKLSVLHRLIVMDRVRGLATAVTALEGRVRNAWRALADYMEQSPVRQRIGVQMEEIVQMNVIAVARREGENMVKAVQMLVDDAVTPATGAMTLLEFKLLLGDWVQEATPALQEEDIDLKFIAPTGSLDVYGDQGLLQRLVRILIRRMADLHEDRLQVELRAEAVEGGVELMIRASVPGWSEGQVASLFAAAIPLQKWPIGLDMDMLSAFLIVHHHGGRLTLDREGTPGPGFRIFLPSSEQPLAKAQLDQDWFDTVYDSIEQWENELFTS